MEDSQTTDGGAYPPLNTLKSLAADAWLVDGPIIRFGAPWPRMPFPTRMTIFRLADGGLFVHSPTALTADLRGEVEAIGVPRWIVAPNRLHFWWIPQWREAYPDAQVYLAPRVREQAGAHIDFPAAELRDESGYPWDGQIDTVAAPGDFMIEFEFFHRASRTLVLTDLIENFEPSKVGRAMRWLTWLGGVRDPDGQTPRDMRFTFRRHRPELRRALEVMVSWNPERLILAHGRWYSRDAVGELRRALRWIKA